MTGEPTPRLRARGVTVRFGPTTALASVDLDVGAGEVHAVIGENGAGKSTLMKVVYGVVRPDAGSIAIDGAEVDVSSPARARALGIAMVFQHFVLFDSLTLAENESLASVSP